MREVKTVFGNVTITPVKDANGLILCFKNHNFSVSLSCHEGEQLAIAILTACSSLGGGFSDA